jgi:hypothetical protein
MPHSVESTISLSDRDLARGAIDLAPENDLPPANVTLFETAVSVIKEVGPKVIEVITSHLTPVIPNHSGAISHAGTEPPAPAPSFPSEVMAGLPTGTEVMVSPPMETIIVIPSSINSSHPEVPVVHDTVCLLL